jgi:myb proto-oncogene protein
LDAVQTHGDKDWVAISALVPGRTRKQCYSRWQNDLGRRIGGVSGRTGKWTEDEDSNLKNVVQTHGAKAWAEIAALVPGRTTKQCRCRWKDALNPSIGGASGRTGKWTAVEDSKLKDAVQTHGDKGWSAISALILGRTEKQCNNRWNYVLRPNIDGSSGRMGT